MKPGNKRSQKKEKPRSCDNDIRQTEKKDLLQEDEGACLTPDNREVNYRTLFEHMAPGVFYQRSDGCLTDVNPAALKMFGLTRDQFIGKDSYDPQWKVVSETGETLVPEEHPSMIALMTGEPVRNRVLGLYNTGRDSIVWVRIHATPEFRSGEATPYQVFVTMDDITELKRAEEAYRQISERLSLATYSGGVGIWEFDIANNLLICDDQTYQIYGIPPDKYNNRNLYETWRGMVHTEDLARVEGEFQSAIQGTREFNTEFRIRWPDGFIHNIHASARVHYDSSGNPRSLIGTNYDITDRMQTEEGLRKSERNYRDLFEWANDAITLHTLTTEGSPGRFIDANLVACRMLGYTRDELLTLGPPDIVPPQFHHQLGEVIRQGIANETVIFEILLRRKDGTTLPVESSGHLITYEGKRTWLSVIRDITERKRAQEAVRESEERLRQIAENNPSVFYVHDRASTRFIYVSPAYEKVWGRPSRELYDDPYSFLEAVHPDDLAFVREAIRMEMVEGKYFDREYRIIQPEGEIRWIHSRNFPVVNEQGEVYRVIGVAEDISESREVADKLKESEERFRKIFENSPAGMALATPDFRFFSVNPSWVSMTGYTEEELLKLSFRNITHPDNLARDMKHMRELMEGTIPVYRTEKRYIRKDGSILWGSTMVTAIRDNQGFLSHFVSQIEDITERKHSEDALKKSETKFRTMVEASPDIIWEIDLKGNFTFISSQSGVQIGSAPDELIGQSFFSLIRPESVPVVRESFLEHIKKKSSFTTLEVPALRSDGTPCFIEIRSVPILGTAGTLTGFRGIARDITRQKESEDAVRALGVYNRSLIEASLDPLVTIGYDGKIQDVNLATERITGYSRDTLIGTDFSDYFVDPVKAWNGYQEVFSKGMVRDFPLEIRHRDGTTTPVLYNATQYHDSGGNILGIFAAARDITELKTTQDALRYSEQKYRDLAELMPLSIFEMDLEGHFTYANRYALDLFGYECVDLAGGLDISMMVVPEDLDRAKRNLEEIIHGKRGGNEYRFRLKNGESFTGISYLSLVEKNNHPTGLRGIIVDITDRKHNEDVLRLSHNLLDSANRVLELPALLQEYIRVIKEYSGCNAIGIRLFDEQGMIICEAYTGFTLEPGGTQTPLSIISDTYVYTEVIRGTANSTHPFFTKGGSYNANDTSKILTSVSEETMGSSSDVCNKTGYGSVALIPVRQGERVIGLIYLADHRENNIPLATAQVIEEVATSMGSAIQRVTAERQVRESLEEKEVLLHEIHHRVKNNLARVISLVELQKAQLSDPEDIARFRDLESRIRSMSLVHESLYQSRSFSRIKAQTYVVDLVQHLIQSYGPRSDIRWDIRMGEIELPIDTAIQCGLIITEIVTNSLKYAFPEEWSCQQERGEECKISLSMTEKDGFIILNASDNGRGMPAGGIIPGPRTLGLTLIRILAKNQLHGEMEMDTTRGTSFMIRFVREPDKKGGLDDE